MTQSRQSSSKDLPTFLSEEIISTIKQGDLNKLIMHVENESLSLQGVDKNGFPPIWLAIQHGHLPILSWLVQQKEHSIHQECIWINNEADEQFTYNSPLDLALYLDRIDIIKWIIKETDFSFYHSDKKALIKFFIKKNDIDWLIKEKNWLHNPIIIDYHYQSYALYVAAKTGRLSIVKLLIETHQFKFMPNWENWENFKNYLHYVLSIGQLEIAKWLVDEKGFSLEEVNKYKNIILLVIKNGHLALLKWLVDDKAYCLDVKDKNNNNVLIHSLYSGHFLITKWLVEDKFFSLDIKDNEGQVSLLLACAHGSLETVKWLVEEKKIPLNICDGFGRNPVIQATVHNQLDILKYLVDEKGCSLEVKSVTNGNYPTHYAAHAGHLDVLKWLIDVKNFSLTKENKHNLNIMYIARASFAKHIVEWLIKEKNIFQYSYFRDSMKADYREYMYFDEFQLLYCLLINSKNNIERKEWIEIIDQQIVEYSLEINSPILKDSYESALEKMKQENHMFYEILLKHYCNQYSMNYLLQLSDIVQVMNTLYELIHDESSNLKTKKIAKIHLAEMLLLGHDIEEENSPLNLSDSFLTDENSIMKRAIQAFFLLHDIHYANVAAIKKRLNNILSKNTSLLLCERTQKDWDVKANTYFYLYRQYKKIDLQNNLTKNCTLGRTNSYGRLFYSNKRQDEKSTEIVRSSSMPSMKQ